MFGSVRPYCSGTKCKSDFSLGKISLVLKGFSDHRGIILSKHLVHEIQAIQADGGIESHALAIRAQQIAAPAEYPAGEA